MRHILREQLKNISNICAKVRNINTKCWKKTEIKEGINSDYLEGFKEEIGPRRILMQM